MTHFGFGKALAKLRDGFLVARDVWGLGVYLEMDDGQLWAVEGDPSVLTKAGARKLYQSTTEDILSEDWRVAESK